LKERVDLWTPTRIGSSIWSGALTSPCIVGSPTILRSDWRYIILGKGPSTPGPVSLSSFWEPALKWPKVKPSNSNFELKGCRLPGSALRLEWRDDRPPAVDSTGLGFVLSWENGVPRSLRWLNT
jgi:hypothetical protein